MSTLLEEETLRALASIASASGRFASVAQCASGLTCQARCAASAHYALERRGSEWVIRLATPDRWLSESIESELVESRDSMEELLLEELKDRDWAEPPVAVKHFRDDLKQYVFEAALMSSPSPATDRTRLATLFLSFEAMFAQLGDMAEGAGD